MIAAFSLFIFADVIISVFSLSIEGSRDKNKKKKKREDKKKDDRPDVREKLYDCKNYCTGLFFLLFVTWYLDDIAMGSGPIEELIQSHQLTLHYFFRLCCNIVMTNHLAF